MGPGGFRFDAFHLDPGDRRLTRDGAPVELNARYLDALALLVVGKRQIVLEVMGLLDEVVGQEGQARRGADFGLLLA